MEEIDGSNKKLLLDRLRYAYHNANGTLAIEVNKLLPELIREIAPDQLFFIQGSITTSLLHLFAKYCPKISSSTKKWWLATSPCKMGTK